MGSQAVFSNPLMLGDISFNHYQAIRLISMSVSYILILFLPLCFNISVLTLNRYWHTALNTTPCEFKLKIPVYYSIIARIKMTHKRWWHTVHMYGPSADHTSITTVLYYCMLLLYYTSITTVLQQYIIRILRGGTKTVEEEQFSATKWSQGELIHSLFWFQREYLGGEEWYDSTPHAAFLLLSARMATLSFLVTLAPKPVI